MWKQRPEAFNSNKPLDAVYLELTDEEPSMDGYFIEGDYTYKITTDGNVRILAYGGSEADVVVPATLGWPGRHGDRQLCKTCF